MELTNVEIKNYRMGLGSIIKGLGKMNLTMINVDFTNLVFR